MKVKQYVMAYRADENEIKRLLPQGFESLRPVLRINVECYDGDEDWGYIEFNTPVAAEGKRGWLNISAWLAKPDYMELNFEETDAQGGCPREDDNDGCFYWDYEVGKYAFLDAEDVSGNKIYCNCDLNWELPPANEFFDDDERIRSFIKLPVEEILGAYTVEFDREFDEELGEE
ncbi:MAG: hypothetical protein Q4B78_05355 [Bacillota bacterium]|nr:hypothetical protein [Bacillota bacterium]